MDRRFCISGGYNYPSKRTKFTSTEKRATDALRVWSCQRVCCEINPVGNADIQQKFVNFPSLQSLQVQNFQKYAKVITELRNDFDHRFADFKKSAMHFNVFSCPFPMKIEEVLENLQMKGIDLQCSSDLREKFKDFPLLEFYKKYVSKEKYQRIHRLAVFVTSLFGSTYLCEQVFSRMNHVKSPVRSLLSDSHMENSLRIATSSILPNIAKLVREKQCQTSHWNVEV